PARLVRRDHQAAVDMARQVRTAVQPRGVAAGLLVDQHAGEVVPGHHFAEHREMDVAAGDDAVFLRRAAVADLREALRLVAGDERTLGLLEELPADRAGHLRHRHGIGDVDGLHRSVGCPDTATPAPRTYEKILADRVMDDTGDRFAVDHHGHHHAE